MNKIIQIREAKIFVSPDHFQTASAMIKKLSTCAIAEELLIKVASLAKLTLAEGPFATTFETPDVTIFTTLKTDQNPVSAFAFELFNAQNHKQFDDVHLLAEEGNLSLEDYVKQIETIESESTIGRLDLKKQCKKAWNLQIPNPLPTSIDAKLTNLENILWHGEWTCHTDFYRSQWVKFYQKNYCKYHPKDPMSCDANKDQFCYSKYSQLKNPKEKGSFLTQRLCNGFFAKATDTMKPALVPMVKSSCPNILRKHEL